MPFVKRAFGTIVVVLTLKVPRIIVADGIPFVLSFFFFFFFFFFFLRKLAVLSFVL